MTRDEAKEAAMVMLAYANGEQVQVQLADGSWIDFPINPHFDWNHVNQRIKPQPKYRPFETEEECLEEMHKHPDWGWIIAKGSKIMYHIYVVGIRYLLIDGMSSISFPETFAEYEFTDGTPFGIKEE